MSKTSKHDWHWFDEAEGLSVRQSTNKLRANKWEVRKADGSTFVLSDEEFEQLCAAGPNPKGL